MFYSIMHLYMAHMYSTQEIPRSRRATWQHQHGEHYVRTVAARRTVSLWLANQGSVARPRPIPPLYGAQAGRRPGQEGTRETGCARRGRYLSNRRRDHGITCIHYTTHQTARGGAFSKIYGIKRIFACMTVMYCVQRDVQRLHGAPRTIKCRVRNLQSKTRDKHTTN